MKFVFVDLSEHYEKTFLYEHAHDSKGKPVPVRQVLWGDFLWLDSSHDFSASSEWTFVVWAPNNPEKRRELKIRTRDVSVSRPLEIIFVDVGQGDGCVLITPERDERERIIVIDAGKTDDMGKFLDSRFGAYQKGMKFHAAVITHPDNDHYLGFKDIFAAPEITFEKVYHSGLVERPFSGTWAKLGGRKRRTGEKLYHLENIVQTDTEFRAEFDDPSKFGRKDYPNTIKGALEPGKVGKFEILAKDTPMAEHSWMPEFGPDDARGYTVEVLGPILLDNPHTGGKRLRCFGDKPRNKDGSPRTSASYGHTKNGHSVILRLQYGSFSVLFGGDLNRSSEEYLLNFYGNREEWPQETVERDEMVAMAGQRFRSDVMKACHHGSSDVTDEFLEAVHPAAFVISSGDEEGHVHPRPDLLGRLGRKGRGSSPVLLSTELQRSWRKEEKEEKITEITKAVKALEKNPDEDLRKEITAKIEALGGSNVSVDGAIYVKTDGHRLITAFKKELQSETDRWFYFEYRIVNNRLILEPRGGH